MHVRGSDVLTSPQTFPVQSKTVYQKYIWNGQPRLARVINNDIRNTQNSTIPAENQMYLCDNAELPQSERPARKIYLRLSGPSGILRNQRSLQPLPTSYNFRTQQQLVRTPYRQTTSHDSVTVSPRSAMFMHDSRPRKYQSQLPRLLVQQTPKYSAPQINRNTASLVRPIGVSEPFKSISSRLAQIPHLSSLRRNRNLDSSILSPRVNRTKATESGRFLKFPKKLVHSALKVNRTSNLLGSGEGSAIKNVTRKQLEAQEFKEKEEVLNKLEDLQALRREILKDLIEDNYDEEGGGDDEEDYEGEEDDNTILEPLYMPSKKKESIPETASDTEEINADSSQSLNLTDEGDSEDDEDLLEDVEDSLFDKTNRSFEDKLNRAYSQFDRSIYPLPYHMWYDAEPDDFLYV